MSSDDIIDRLKEIKDRSIELDKMLDFEDPTTWNEEESDLLEEERYNLTKELLSRGVLNE